MAEPEMSSDVVAPTLSGNGDGVSLGPVYAKLAVLAQQLNAQAYNIEALTKRLHHVEKWKARVRKSRKGLGA